VRRKLNVTEAETWQIYGMDGELLAEYAQNASYLTPQKEYGYRNGQLLITAEAPSGASTNVALAANGGTAVASSTLASFNPGIWLDNTYQSFPDWIEIDFNGAKTINEIDVITQQDDYQNPVEPSLGQSFSLYGLTGFEVQYWNGSGWATVPDGNVTGNNKVWRQFSFPSITTSKIKVVVNAGADNAYSRVVEVEAWSAAGQTQNVVWTNAVGVSSSGNSLTKTATTGWGNAGASSTQTLAAGDGYVEVTVAELSRSRIFGFSHTDTNQSWDTIDYGLHCANDANHTIYVYESGTQRGTFGSYASGDKLRVAMVGGVVKYSRNGTVFYTSTVTPSYPLRVDTALYENGATIGSAVFSSGTTDSSSGINWLVTDQLGTPRMVFDKTGSLAATKRHDYLPFGEEIFAGTGGRDQGYPTSPNSNDEVRQKFTQKERDIETGLDYFGARYYANTQGRFTSADAPFADQEEGDPQSWNLYAYVRNNPLRYIDPFGDAHWEVGTDGQQHYVGDEDGEYDKDLNAVWMADCQYWEFQEDPSAVTVPIPGFNDFAQEMPIGSGKWVVLDPEPPMGGGLRHVGRRAPGVLAKMFRWFRFGKKASQALPILRGATGKEMIRDAIRIVKSSGGSAAEKADLLEKLTIQIMERTGASWNAVRATGTDGSSVFIGRAGELLVVNPAGELFRGSLKTGGIKSITDAVPTPVYELLRRID
jgi:RHS repeat-associated protein